MSRTRLGAFNAFIGKTFALWAILFGLLGFWFPAAFKPVLPWVPWLLGVVMLGMGMTLQPSDFSLLARRPWAVILGVVAHYVIMPGTAWVLARAFHLPPEIAVGVILVGCCPSGTASNVMTFLARGDVPLSVTISAVSTLLAPLATPGIFYLLARQWLHVDAGAMFVSILQIVLLPIVLGLVLRKLLRGSAAVVDEALPLVSVAAIVLIVAGVVAASHAKIVESGLLIFAVVVLHNGFGYLLGYLAGRLGGLPYAAQKSLALEVGMQNSGLGAALAAAYFTPLAAVPSAIFSFWHNVSGPLLASYWAARADRAERTDAASMR